MLSWLNSFDDQATAQYKIFSSFRFQVRVDRSNQTTHITKCFVVSLMEKGKNEWGMAFCMSQSGNPVCHPEPWRSKTSSYWKHFKKDADRGDYVQMHSDRCT